MGGAQAGSSVHGIFQARVLEWGAIAFSETVLGEAKGKEEKERCTHLNAEFQSIARREKKAFLSDQHKEIKENNRMRKTSDLFKKTGDIKGTFHAKMGTIKERNGKGLTEAKEIKKRWQEYTEELYKKDIFMIQITTMVWSLT